MSGYNTQADQNVPEKLAEKINQAHKDKLRET